MNLVIHALVKHIKSTLGLRVEDWYNFIITSNNTSKINDIAESLHLSFGAVHHVAAAYKSCTITSNCMIFDNKADAEECLTQIIYRALFHAIMEEENGLIKWGPSI